jgi:hypothetical protein
MHVLSKPGNRTRPGGLSHWKTQHDLRNSSTS